jgi:hypothetical protein
LIYAFEDFELAEGRNELRRAGQMVELVLTGRSRCSSGIETACSGAFLGQGWSVSIRPLLRRLPARTQAQPEKIPRFRGASADEPSRIRTGDCGLRAWKSPPDGFVSVGDFGGSVWLPIRLMGTCRNRRTSKFARPPAPP